MADLTMLRRELVIGYTVAGFLAVAVPPCLEAVFLHGHGFWTSLENVVVGPFIAIVSFVCSIGNVPLAASLWPEASPSGGDLVHLRRPDHLPSAPHLPAVLRGRLTVRMLAVFWAVMSIAG